MLTPPSWDRAARVLVVVQVVLFLAVAHSEAPQAWTVLSAYFAEIAADLLGEGGSPLDGYDGLVFGPVFYAVLEAPLLAVLGRVGAVHAWATAIVAAATTWATYRFVGRVATKRAGFLAALLVAFPPPNTWVHQHFGAYHVLPLAMVPLAGLLVWKDRAGPKRWFGGGLLIGLSVGASLGAVSLGPPLLAARLLVVAAQSRARALIAAGSGLGGVLLGLAPIAYKSLVHVPFGGLAPAGEGSAARAVKPLFLPAQSPLEILARPVRMLTRDLPYGTHFGFEGVEAAGWVFVVVAYLAFGYAAWVAFRSQGPKPAWAPILAIPPAVIAVGALTGWFVFHPGDGDGWARDARHIVGLTLAFAWLIGIAADRLPAERSRRAALIVAVLAMASLGTQLRAVASAGGEFHLLTPWRLEGRFVAGFFRGPAFVGDPEGAIASCADLPETSRLGCERGVGLAFGHGVAGLQAAGGPAGPLLRDHVRRIGTSGAESAVFHGLGWAHAQRAFGKPERAVLVCRDPSLSREEREACVEGVGWGYAMDFADRPGRVLKASARMAPKDARAFARGVGVLYRDLMVDEAARKRRCLHDLPEHLRAVCMAAAEP